MPINKTEPGRNISLYAAIAAYVLLGLVLLPLYRYQVNPDGISYISIAQKYLNLDFKNIINGHWSPLFSWLLVPLLALGLDPLWAVKFLNLCIGAVTFIAVDRLSHTLALSQYVRKTLHLALVPVVLYFAYYLITPDQLLTCLLLFYFNALFREDYVSRKRGIAVGALGGICYLAKSYCFPFFAAHFALMNIVYCLRCSSAAERKKVVYNYITGMLIFCVISGVWIGLLSNKYGEFTVTTQTAHNYHSITPEPQPATALVAPPNETAISVWEDPYVRIEKIAWSPYESPDAVKHWLKYFMRNIMPTIRIVAGFSIIAFLLCGAYCLRGLLDPCGLFAERAFFFPCVSAGLYALGYCFILVDERYIWIVCLLVMLMGGYVLTNMLQRPLFRSGRKKQLAVLAVFCLSFYIAPVTALLATVNSGKEEYEVCETLQEIVPPGSRAASSGDFYTMLSVGYHMRLRYYGTTESYGRDTIAAALDSHGIDYFFGWEGDAQLEELAPDTWRRVAQRSIRGTALYVVKRIKQAGHL